MKNVALVLEGGGSKGAFTVGVLDSFMENKIKFPYVIGVSAGAVSAISYVSNQKGRARQTTIDLCNIEDIISYKNIFTNKSIFDLELLFDKLPNEKNPFDYKTFFESETKCIITVTNCETGKAEYFEEKEDKDRLMKILTASTALPFLTHKVEIDGKYYLDGGISDSVPVIKAKKDGYNKRVVVLTKPKGYRKDISMIEKNMAILFYNKFPNLVKSIVKRYKIYNKTMEKIESLEESGKLFVIRPQESFIVSRTEKDYEPLMRLYHHGYETTNQLIDALESYINEE